MANTLWTPGPGFDDPLALLHACHERILRFAGALSAPTVDPGERKERFARIHRYFSTAGIDHHRDEEDDLFPRLEGLGEDAVLAALTREHETLEGWFALLTPTLLGEREPDRAFEETARAFERLTARHVALEESVVFPLAKARLKDADWAALGARMAARRGVSTTEP